MPDQSEVDQLIRQLDGPLHDQALRDLKAMTGRPYTRKVEWIRWWKTERRESGRTGEAPGNSSTTQHDAAVLEVKNVASCGRLVGSAPQEGYERFQGPSHSPLVDLVGQTPSDIEVIGMRAEPGQASQVETFAETQSDAASRSRKLLYSCLVIVVGLILVSLAGILRYPNGPSRIAEDYYGAIWAGRTADAYTLLSKWDRRDFPLMEFLEWRTIRTPFPEHVSLSSRDEEVRGETASVTVVIRHPDIEAMVGRVVMQAFSKAFGKEDSEAAQDEQMRDALRNAVAQGSVPMTTSVEHVELILEDGDWRVFVDVPAFKNLQRALASGDDARRDGDLDAAIAQYQRALSLDPQNNVAKRNVDEIEQLQEKARRVREEQESLRVEAERKAEEERRGREQDENARKAALGERFDYLAKIRIQNGRWEESSDGQIRIDGELRNEGSRTLRNVTITIQLLDRRKNPIFKKDYDAVLSGGAIRGFNNKSLEPGEVREFGYVLLSSRDWNREVNVFVTNVEFEDSLSNTQGGR